MPAHGGAGAWRILDADTGARGHLYARAFTATRAAYAGLGWMLTARVRFEPPGSASGSFFSSTATGSPLAGQSQPRRHRPPHRVVDRRIRRGDRHHLQARTTERFTTWRSATRPAAVCDVLLDGVPAGRVAASIKVRPSAPGSYSARAVPPAPATRASPPWISPGASPSRRWSVPAPTCFSSDAVGAEYRSGVRR
ncbi:MAG: hypothetical protein U1F77_13955 [Kiritimatiellia bacterium]